MKRNIEGGEIPKFPFPFPTEILVVVINFLELCDMFNFRLTCKYVKYTVRMAVKGWGEHEKEYKVMKNLYREPKSKIFEISIRHCPAYKEEMNLCFEYTGDLFYMWSRERFVYEELDEEKCYSIDKHDRVNVYYYAPETFLLSNITKNKTMYPRWVGIGIFMTFIGYAKEERVKANSVDIIGEILYFLKRLREFMNLDHVWKYTSNVRLRTPYRDERGLFLADSGGGGEGYWIESNKHDLADLVTYSKYMRTAVKDLRVKNKVVDLEDTEEIKK